MIPLLSEKEQYENSIKVLAGLLTERDNQLQRVLEVTDKLLDYIDSVEGGLKRPLLPEEPAGLV